MALLIEVMVNLSDLVSALPCGSRRTMMSDQWVVAALTPARLVLPSRLAITLAAPPLWLNSNVLALNTSAHPFRLTRVGFASTGAPVSAFAFACSGVAGVGADTVEGSASGVVVTGSGEAPGVGVATGAPCGVGSADGVTADCGNAVEVRAGEGVVTAGDSGVPSGDGSGVAVTAAAGVSVAAGVESDNGLSVLLAFVASNVAVRAGAEPICASSPAGEPLTFV